MEIELIQNLKQPQISAVKLREWQRYRGWTIAILAELEHNDAETTRVISDAIGCNPNRARNNLCRMLKVNLVERAERWGWRITRDGNFVLLLQQHTITTPPPHHYHTTTTPQEKEEPVPSCFHAATCHIKRICQDKRFTLKTMTLCQNCVWDPPHQQIKPRLPVEKKGVGSKC